MSTSVKPFSWDMPGAPVLSGTAGTLLAVLDACLVTGWGLQTAASATITDGVCKLTLPTTPAMQVGSVALVAGATPASLNGEQRVTAITSNTMSFATTETGAVTGTITVKLAPAGWLKSFSGTNLAVYKSADPASTGMFLRVDDTGTLSARVVGYEQMTDVNTGTGAFPKSTVMAGGGYIPKSSVANTTAVRWYLVADGRGMLLSISVYSATTATSAATQNRYIGDIIPFRPGGDAYAYSLGYGSAAGYNAPDGIVDTGSVFQAMPRAYHGLGDSVLHASLPYTGANTSFSGMDNSLGAFPSVVDGGLRLSRRYVAESVSSPPRGNVPGVLTVPQSALGVIYKSGDSIQGTGDMTGRKLLALSTGINTATFPSASNGVMFVDVTGPWR